MEFNKSQLAGKSGFERLMLETFEDHESKKHAVQAFIINALIIISIGAIIYESYIENKIETTQALAEQAYRQLERDQPEIKAAIEKVPYDEERYHRLYDELFELRLTSRPDYLLDNPAYLDIYEATANAEAPSLTLIEPKVVHKRFIKAITYFEREEEKFASNESYVTFRDAFKEWGQTIDQQHYIKYQILAVVDLIALFFFILEYAAQCYLGRSKITGFVFSANGIIDAMAILPSLIEPLVKIIAGSAGGLGGLQIVKTLRLLRLMRLLRMLKLAAAVVSGDGSEKTPEERKNDAIKMNLVIALMGLGMCVVMFSALIVFCERGAQPDAFPHIPAAMWWGIVTLTTVGYGDVSPITPAGQIIAGVAGLMSVVIFALMLGAIGGVVDEFMSDGSEDEVGNVGAIASPSEQIATLAGLLEAGHLSQEEFDDKKANLLDQI